MTINNKSILTNALIDYEAIAIYFIVEHFACQHFLSVFPLNEAYRFEVIDSRSSCSDYGTYLANFYLRINIYSEQISIFITFLAYYLMTLAFPSFPLQ
jgi:hypothetical protein